APTAGSSVQPWTETFQFDGFGNLTGEMLNAGTSPIGVNAATNRLSSAGYDANGNMTSAGGSIFIYDEANRMTSAAQNSGGVEYYGYAPDNKRVYRMRTDGVEEFTLYGANGQKLGAYNIQGNCYPQCGFGTLYF